MIKERIYLEEATLFFPYLKIARHSPSQFRQEKLHKGLPMNEMRRKDESLTNFRRYQKNLKQKTPSKRRGL